MFFVWLLPTRSELSVWKSNNSNNKQNRVFSDFAFARGAGRGGQGEWVMGGVFSDFAAAGGGGVWVEYFQILRLREGWGCTSMGDMTCDS